MNHKRTLEGAAAICVYAAVLIFCFWRLSFGVSVVDEPLYIALADLPRIGGHWFVSDLTIQTTSAMLMAPFINTYTAMVGTEGVVLFSRILYFLLTLITSSFCYRLGKEFLRKPAALILSAIPIIFIGHNLSSLYYNGLGSNLFAIASILSFLALRHQKWSLIAWSGCVWVLCVFAYPSMAAMFIVSTALCLWRTSDRKAYLTNLMKGILIPGLLLGGVLLAQGVDNILAAIEFSKICNQPGAAWKIPYSLSLLWDAYGPAIIPIGVAFGAWISLSLLRPSLAFLGPCFFMISFFIWGAGDRVFHLQILWVVLQVTFIIPLFFDRKKIERNEMDLLWILIVPAIFGSLIVCLTSLQTLFNTYITGLFGAFGVILLICRKNQIAAWSLGLILLIAAAQKYTIKVYEDGPLAELTHEVTVGPYKGIWTGPRKASVLETLYLDLGEIRRNATHGETILFKDQFPSGYLMTGLSPKGSFITYLAPYLFPQVRSTYRQMFQNPSSFPDLVIEFRFFPASEHDDMVYLPPTNVYHDEFYDFFHQSGKYRTVLDRGAYRILQRQDLP